MATEQISLAEHQYSAETKGQCTGGAVAAHRLADREGRRALENITLRRQLRVLFAQPVQLRAFALAQRTVAAGTRPALMGAPVAQRALVDAQIPGHLRDRLTGLPNDPHRPVGTVALSGCPRREGRVARGRCRQRQDTSSVNAARTRSWTGTSAVSS